MNAKKIKRCANALSRFTIRKPKVDDDGTPIESEREYQGYLARKEQERISLVRTRDKSWNQ